MPPSRRKPGPSIASTIFVDREEPKSTFEKAAFSIPAQGCLVRTWYGVGGQGKTALARELFRISDASFEPSYSHLRRAMLDLHGRPINDPDRLLVWIRNAFSKAGISFPAFDLAFAIMWQKTRGEEPLPNFDNPWLHRTGHAFSATMPDAIAITRGFIEQLSGTIPGLGFLINQGTKWVFDKGKRAWLDRTRPQLEAFYRNGSLIPDHEMSALMAWMLAQDLNQHLEGHPTDRFVLFVDEYERVMEGAGTGARWRENMFDAHMRSFVAETDGLLAIFFSRERLHWEEDPDWRDTVDGHQHLLGGLSDNDAQKWLLSVPVEAADLRAAIIEGARETQEPAAPVYPLMLDLQVEHWRNLGAAASAQNFTVAAASFEGRRRELIERLLRDYDDAIQDVLSRLALVGRFDRVTFEHVVTAFHLPLAFGAFDKLAALSIISRDEDGWLSLHRAIAEAILQSVKAETLATTRAVLRAHFEARVPTALADDAIEMTQACVVEAVGLRRQEGHDGYADWLETMTDNLGNFRHAAFLEALWREALDLVGRVYPAMHPDVATCLFALACSLISQGRTPEAEPLLREALQIRLAKLPPHDARLADSCNTLASTLSDLGHFAEANDLFQKGLDIRRALFGDSHPDTALSYDNMAQNLAKLDKRAAADTFYRKALDIRLTVLPQMHSATAASYNNLALNLHEQGHYAQAEPLYRKGLDITLAISGEMHPETATSYSNLAGLADDSGELEQVEPLHRKALSIRLATLGAAHPDTAMSYTKLGYWLWNAGQLSEAETCYRKALEIRRTALGENNTDTISSYQDLAIVLTDQDRADLALPLLQQAVECAHQLWGTDHTDTADACALLARHLEDHTSPEKAEPLRRKALEIQSSVLGPTDTETIERHHDLAGNLALQGRWSEALAMSRQTLAICVESLGEDVAITGESYHNVAFILEKQRRFDEAEPYFRKALDVLQRAHGHDHHRTARAHGMIAENCFARVQLDEALSHFEAALSIVASLGEDHPDVQMARDSVANCKRAMKGA